MYTALQKIHKDKDAEPTEFEENVAQVIIMLWLFWSRCSKEVFNDCLIVKAGSLIYPQALFDLENTNQEIKSDLKDLHINSAVYVF